MLGALITFAFAIGWLGLAHLLAGKLTSQLDMAARVGVSGLIGLGCAGLLTFFIGLVPGGLSWGAFLVGAMAVVGLASLRSFAEKPSLPQGLWLIPLVVILLAGLMALISVLAPSDMNDWDSLAYHLAVPKLWLQSGQISYIPFIHQSNFPFAVDNLYIWGLKWGGESGAKAFELCFFAFGALSIFGLARKRYGEKAAWWAAVAFATIPSVLWEAGTGYVDMAHGLYAGFGIVFAALLLESTDRRYLWLAALMLGFGAASKYTGLQTIFATCAVVTIIAAISKRLAFGLQSAVTIGLVALAIGSPWLIRNVVNTGNPVYPFFYEQLGARNWDQRRADIYRREQQSFGVGHEPTALGHAVLGLAYQPGRYVNPAQDRGLGSPLGALGCAVLAAWLLWMVAGRTKRSGPEREPGADDYETVIIATVLLSALMWFILSQQSRYIITWAVPLAVILGGGIVRLKLGQALAAVVVVQAAVSLFLMSQLRTSSQIHAALGDVSSDQYRTQTIPFFEAAKAINALGQGTKVALYDEVFGYLLDVPYFWANPGHSTVIPYDEVATSQEYSAAMKQLGFTHIYVNPSAKEKNLREQWLASMGLRDDVPPLDDHTRRGLFDNWETKWMVLVADGVKNGSIVPVQSFRGGLLFKLQ